MTRLIAVLTMVGAIGALADTKTKWQYAGENQGIRFHFKIANECRDAGARVEMKLENTLDRAVTVSFRLVDPDWKQSFERELEPLVSDFAIKYTPDEGKACHPFVDDVFVESMKSPVSHSEPTGKENTERVAVPKEQ